VPMEWRPAGWSVCQPLVILPSNIKSRRSFLLPPAHPDGPRKRAVKQLWCGVVAVFGISLSMLLILGSYAMHVRFLREIYT